MKNFVFFVGLLCHGAAEIPEALQDLQMEFLLPYSETEDVDFTIARPAGFGCYQWSTDATDLIVLDPVITDFDKMCSSKLDFRIVPKMAPERRTFTIVAENVDLDSDDADIPVVAEYKITVAPVAKLEIMGLKTEMVAGSEPAPFGVSGYDDEENEFDTLDGLQISWFIGALRDIAEFERLSQTGPIIKMVPKRSGQGAIIAVLTDPNYEGVVERAFIDFTITAPLQIEPDGAYILVGATAPMKLYEKVLKGDEEQLFEIPMNEKSSEFFFYVKPDDDVIALNPNTSTITGLQEGETTLFVKSILTDEIVKGMPVRVTTPSRVTVTTEQNPGSRDLVLGDEYDVSVNIVNEDGRPIYPSENILCKLTFPKQLRILDISENGLKARVSAVAVGFGKVKASLRSVLTEDEEELEIVPHVKGSADFAVYEAVVITPKETILPWDENEKPSYDLKYKATGGGQVYTYTTDNEDIAHVADEEGKVVTTGGPGVVTVRAAMKTSKHIYDEAKIYILPATHLELRKTQQEYPVFSDIRIPLRMMTLLPDREEPFVFTDCSDAPFNVTLSDTTNFEYKGKFQRGGNHFSDACTSITIRGKTPGTSTKVTVSYTEPSTGRTMRAFTHLSSYTALQTVFPPMEVNHNRVRVYLPVGSSTKVKLVGGPHPWINKPSSHYTQIEVDDDNVIKVEKIGGNREESETYSDEHEFLVTCLDIGETLFDFTVGSHQSSTNKHPAADDKEIPVLCSQPKSIQVFPKLASRPDERFKTDPKTGKLLLSADESVRLYITVKNNKGKRFMNTSTILFDSEVSDKSVLRDGGEVLTESDNTKPFKIFHTTGSTGDVSVTLSVSGYDAKKIEAVGATLPPPIHTEENDEDEDDFDELSETVEFKVISKDEYEKLTK